MQINVLNFKEVLKKATLNNIIDSVQLNFGDGRIKTKMINESSDAIIFLDVENNVLTLNGETTFNFREPAQNLIPFLNIIDDDMVDVDIERSKIILKNGSQKSNIHFASPAAVRTFGSEPREMTYFITLPIDDTFLDILKKIKKIGNKFGKIYFSVEDGKFVVETTDKTNQFSNGLKFELTSIEKDNLSMYFDYKNFINLMEVINGNAPEFQLNFAWVESQEKGALVAKRADGSETYFLMSREE